MTFYLFIKLNGCINFSIKRLFSKTIYAVPVIVPSIVEVCCILLAKLLIGCYKILIYIVVFGTKRCKYISYYYFVSLENMQFFVQFGTRITIGIAEYCYLHRCIRVTEYKRLSSIVKRFCSSNKALNTLSFDLRLLKLFFQNESSPALRNLGNSKFKENNVLLYKENNATRISILCEGYLYIPPNKLISTVTHNKP